jgi:hypothetical protein
MLSVANQNKQLDAEMALFKLQTQGEEDKGFSLNPLGYSSFGSWFTSANTGLWLSKALEASTLEEDPIMEKWYIERGWVEFGANQVDAELDKYRALGETRDFTKKEHDTVIELQKRKNQLTKDLHHVYKYAGGDYDVPIDVKGQSMNERWGIDHANDPGVKDFLKMLVDNPTYTLGLFTSELIKDLPLSVLGYVGLTAKTAGGASALSTAVKTLNKIQPKIMRNIAKIGTGVAASSAVGAGYEAAYTYGTQGDVKGHRVKSGAKFGAAFGVLAGLGLLSNKVGGVSTTAGKTSKTLETPEAPKEKGGVLSDEKELDAVTKAVITAPEKRNILNPAEELAKNPNKIFPELKESSLVTGDKGVVYAQRKVFDIDGNLANPDYILVNLATKEGKAYARQHNWTGRNKDNTLDGFNGVMTVINNAIENGKPHIVIDYNKTTAAFNVLKNNFTKHVGADGRLRKVSPREYVFLKSQASFNSFLFAKAKANIKVNAAERQLEAEGKGTVYKDKDGKDVEANQLAAEELRRAYDAENKKEYTSRSEEDLLDRDNIEEPKLAEIAPVGKLGRGMDYLEKNPLHAAGIAAGAGALTYGLSDKDTPGSDAILNSLVAVAAVGIGPKARAWTKGTPLNRITANIKAQVARGLEVDAATAKAWEANVQGISDRLDKKIQAIRIASEKAGFPLPLETIGLAFTEFIEGGMVKRVQFIQDRKVYIDDELVALAKDYRKVLDEIGEQAVLSGLIKDKASFSRLKFGAVKQSGAGAFLSNYIPHIFLNVDELPEEVLMRIYGKIDSMQTKDRTIKGTLAEVKRMIDEEEFDDIEGWGKYVSTTTGKPWEIGSFGMLEVNPVRLLSIYTQGMTRAIIGRNAIESMRRLDMAPNGKKPKGYQRWKDAGKPQGKDYTFKKDESEFDIKDYSTRRVMPAVVKKAELEQMRESGQYSKQELLHYKQFRHPALDGYMGHNNVMKILDSFFAVSSKEGLMALPEKLLKLNNGLKRVYVFGSLFHSQALFMSAVYALGPIGAIKGTLPKSLGGARGKTGSVEWLKLQLGTDSFYTVAQQAIKDGLQVVNIKRQELVNPGKPNIDPLLDKLGPSGQIARKGFDAIDTLTWEYLHDRFKLATYIRHKERAIERGLSEEAAGRKAAIFANDAFGSLDWNDFSASLLESAAKNPDRWTSKMKDYVASALPINNRRWLNMFLFAPDWTVSNIRIIGKTFWGAPKAGKAASEIFYQKILQGKNWDDPKAQEILAAWQMYGGYTTRAGLYTSALWWAMTSRFSDEEPTADGLWNFWFGKDSGKLDLGGGESMVISKQLAEPVHWIQHFQHTLNNKGAIVPKTAMEAMYNKQWFSLKTGLPLGPRIIDEDGTSHVGKWLFGKVLPISVKPLMTSIVSDDLTIKQGLWRWGTGSLGFPQYGKPEKEGKFKYD